LFIYVNCIQSYFTISHVFTPIELGIQSCLGPCCLQTQRTSPFFLHFLLHRRTTKNLSPNCVSPHNSFGFYCGWWCINLSTEASQIKRKKKRQTSNDSKKKSKSHSSWISGKMKQHRHVYIAFFQEQVLLDLPFLFLFYHFLN